MKSRKTQIHARFHKNPRIRFEKDQELTSFAGAVVFQALFQRIQFKDRLRACFRHLGSSKIFGHTAVVLLLVLHLLLGFRRLRELDYYGDDPLLRHILGLRSLPDVATVSRELADGDVASVARLKSLLKALVIERMQENRPSTLTVDFDGSVVWSKARNVEGTASGFNKQKKGARGYYPLLATVAQLGQVLDILFRPGNVHDSNGACTFVLENVESLKAGLPRTRIESRLDSAFFNEVMLGVLNQFKVEFTISVPFERFVELKDRIENRKRWRRLDDTWSYFEDRSWRPKIWTGGKYRFIFIRQKRLVRRKGEVQLDLFQPRDQEFDYKVIVTNKTVSAMKVLMFHNGRGAQEGLFGELKSQAQFDYIPCRNLVANQTFMLCSALAHNLGRELQMATNRPARGLTDKRAAMWEFRKLDTLRRLFLLRAGRLTRPGNELTLTMSANEAVRWEIENCMQALAA